MARKKSSEKKPQPAQIGIHAVKNLLGTRDQEQLTLFSERREELKKRGLSLDDIDRFGFDLTDLEFRVMEGLARELTRTNYRGNMSPKEKEIVVNEKIATGDPKHSYKYIKEIPRIRATPNEIVEWTGIKNDSSGEKERALAALHKLGTTVYCFYYERLAIGPDGRAEKDSRGQWKKEEVQACDILFLVKEVRDPNTKKLKYFEIEPSSIFLDQIESYYILLPVNWRDEVQQLVGKKRVSSYTFRFLLFLRYQFEMKRRLDAPKPFQIKWTAEEIANALKISEKSIKRNKKQVNTILVESYEIAKELGYISDYDRADCLDIITLNEEKYLNHYKQQNNRQVELPSQPIESNKESEKLFELFYSERQKVDPKLTAPSGITKNREIEKLDELLAIRTFEEISTLIQWGTNHSFWWSQFSNPTKLVKSFSAAWGEMSLSAKSDPKQLTEINRALAKKLAETHKSNIPKLRIEPLNKYLELATGRGAHETISYEDKDFRKKLDHILQKWDITAEFD